MKLSSEHDFDQGQIAAAIRAKRRPAVPRRLRCCMIELAETDDTGSIGAHYVAEHARRAGYGVDAIPPNSRSGGFDVELVSVHHCTDWPRLAALPRRARLRIVGGHVMANNPRPGIPLADAVCIGEGESWIVQALNRLEVDCRAEALRGLPGTIISADHELGAPIPAANVEDPLPDNDPYLNRPGTLSARWYVEIARGCPWSCAYCELGHSMPYRPYSLDHLNRKLALIEPRWSKKVNWFAPDEASHPHYNELMNELKRLHYQQAFGSYRVDQILRRDVAVYSGSQLIRVGVDGLTEATRMRVNKRITDDMLVEFFTRLSAAGHVQFKMFMMIGYPWERAGDFDQWAGLMRRIAAIKVRTNCYVRIKWTPLIPQPCTPLADAEARYDLSLVGKIHRWHELHRVIAKRPGWHFECDGLMSMQSHARQIALTRGDELCLVREAAYINPKWRAVCSDR